MDAAIICCRNESHRFPPSAQSVQAAVYYISAMIFHGFLLFFRRDDS
jgi:hypothetical protein